MEVLKEFFVNYSAWIIELLMLTAGGLLTFRGLKVYKVMQAIICALVGAGIGLLLHERFGSNVFYVVAAVLTCIGGFLGVRYYKFGLYLSAGASGFVVVFSIFMKRALAVIKEASGQLLDQGEFIKVWLDKGMSNMDFSKALAEMISTQKDAAADAMQQAIDLIQKGFLLAMIVAIVLGILALIFGDFILIVSTSALGATLLISLVEMFVYMIPNLHLVLVLLLMSVGVIMQGANAKKSNGRK